MAKKNKNPGRGGYYGGAFEQAGECEGSGSSGRIDAEITASEDSSAPTRKYLLHRLRMELEHIRILQKKVEMHRTNGVTVSSSSDILSCNNGRNGPHIENLRKSSALTGQGKKLNPVASKAQAWNPGTSGRVESVNQASAPSTASVILMKQFEDSGLFTVIKHPMDLGTVKTKIASGSYSSPLEFAADVRTTFTNAMTYNPPTNDVYVMADTLSKFFEVRWKTIEKKLPRLIANHHQLNLVLVKR
ncbi:hypothetical protein Pyn_29269 [Prunus yedoensis var. nudiflora]|uniref:Bromo domain-containing protein n=1 Tax=Prunus yedoensis var. nudiflora TaxID=2094558 RepID=A0A314XZ85_PRUYE|nr:hypothetical protein Pyn_29269 [Prunus yedoensis var. nudiflora]